MVQQLSVVILDQQFKLELRLVLQLTVQYLRLVISHLIQFLVRKITVNENADPDVVTDMLYGLDKAYPDRPEFRHAEGNSAAHLKSSAMGVSKTIPFEDGKMLLGIWQGIYFCEFDGPRTQHYDVKVIEG